VVVWCSFVSVAPLEGATITYAIDPVRSHLFGSGNVLDLVLVPQTPNSLVGALSGYLQAQWDEAGLTFSGGSSIGSISHPESPFLPPASAVGSGSLVDNFGAQALEEGRPTFFATLRDGITDIVSGRANFGAPAMDLKLGFVDGTIDYRYTVFNVAGFLDLAKENAIPNSSTGSLSRTIENQVDTIKLPLVLDIPIKFFTPNDSHLRLEGQIVATLPVLTIESGTLTNINTQLHLTALVVEPDGTIRLAGAPLVTQTLRMSGDAGEGSTLDLTNASTAMIVDYLPGVPTPATDIRQRIIAGRGNTDLIGAWDGKGITSSAAQADPSSLSVGWAVNADLPLGPYQVFHGEIVDPTSVLIRATRIGDANLDGVVDDTDVTIVGATFGTTAGAVWALGDFDYDGDVDDADVTLVGALYDPLATPFGPGLAVTQSASLAAVPEPAGWVLVAIAALAAGPLGWRRNRLRRNARVLD
jgi:hypothetical protein